MKNLLATLRYLVALHDHRHFGRAAEACHITQPALSNAIRTLEADVGAVIVKRGRAFGGFTLEGERLLQSAYRILREQELLTQDLSALADAPSGTVSIGVVPTAAPIAARLATCVQARYPGIRIVTRSMNSGQIEECLESLTVDIGLGYAERPAPSGLHLERIAIYEERYYLLRRCSTPGTIGLAVGEPVRWAEAAALPLCLLTPDMHNRTIVDAAFAQAGARVTPAIETNSILTLAVTATSGTVASVLPGALVRVVERVADLQACALIDPVVSTPMAILVNTDARVSRAFDAVIALVRGAAWISEALEYAALRDQTRRSI